MHIVTFCGKERIMATNIKKFLENYKLIMAYRSEYVQFEYWGIRKTLEICVCTESFTYDDLFIKKGNTYLLRKKYHGYYIYELTGLWVSMGHQAGLLNDRALENGIKGWNIPPKYRGCFKVVKPNQLTSFLYWEDE